MRIYILVISFVFSLSSWAENFYEKALSSYEAQKIDDAYIHLKNALNEDSDNLPAKVLMAKVLVEKGLYRDGIEEFKDVLDLGADPNQFIYEMGRTLLLTKEFDDVISLSEMTNLTQENKVSMLLLKSNAFKEQGKTKQSLATLIQAHTLAPNLLKTKASLAAHYIEQRQFENALTYIEDVIILAPDNARMWHLRGDFYRAQGYGAKALESFEKAHLLDNKDPVVLRSLTHQYAALGLSDKAIALTDVILESAPNDTYIQLLKSRVLISNGDKESAFAILKDIRGQIAQLSEVQKYSDISLSFVSGTSEFLLGNYERAQKELTYYINENPSDLAGMSMLVDVFLKQNQPERVEVLLERYEPLIKKDLALSLRLYNIYLKNNKTFKARGLLAEVEKYFGNNQLIVIAKANYLVKANRSEEAIQLLNSYKPQNFDPYFELNRAKLYMAVNDATAALKISDQLLAHDKNNPEYINFKAAILSNQQVWNQSVELYQQVLALSPELFTAKFNLATAYAAINQHENALKLAAPLYEKYPKNDNVIILFSKLNRDLNNVDVSISALNTLLKAKPRHVKAAELLFSILYSTQQYDKALIEAERLTKLSFLNPVHLTYRAQALTRLGRFDEANIQIGKLLGLSETADNFYQLSLLQADIRDYTAAIKSLDTAIKKSPDTLPFKIQKAKILIALNETKSAKNILSNLYKKDKNNPNILFAQGLASVKDKKFVNAANKFSSALTLDTSFNAAYIKLYQLALKGIKQNEFVAQSKALLNKSPNNYLIRNLFADYYLINGQYQQALPHYLTLEVSGGMNKESLLNNIAYIYSRSDEEQAQTKALTYIEKAYALNQSSYSTLDTFGAILAKQGDFNGSLEKLRQAYAINSNNPSICYHLAYTLAKMNRLDDAIVELNKALAMNIKFAEETDAKQLLKELTKT